MIILQLYRAYALLDFFAQPDPLAVGYVLGDSHYNTSELRDECALHECALLNRELIAARYGGVGRVEVRRLFHKISSLAIERLNGLFKNILEWRGQMPVKGLNKCQLLALRAILLCQIVLAY